MTRNLQTLARILNIATFVILVFVLPGSVSAQSVTLSEYQKNLQSAITALDTLGQLDEDESESGYENRLTQTTAAIRNELPEKLTVETAQSIYNVDNSWLHQGLKEFEAASTTQRDGMRYQLIDRLRSINERVTELGKASASNFDSKAEANRKLQEILGRSEYANQNKQGGAIFKYLFKYIERFVNWLLKFLPQSAMKQGRASPITLIVEIVVVALALAVLIYVAVKVIRHFKGRNHTAGEKKKKKEARIVLGERLEPEASATDLLAEAESLARNGEIRAAIRKAYIALLVELGDRKLVSLAQHKTNRDYLRAVRAHPALYRNMSGLTDSFERHWYGFVQTSPNDWQDFRSGYLAALRAND
jgi:hypothetical protein